MGLETAMRRFATSDTVHSRGASAADPAPFEGRPLVTTFCRDTLATVDLALSLGRALDHVGCHASRSMRPRICRKSVGVEWLSASCKMKYRACRMRRPPVLKSRCWRLVSDQLWMAWGRASRRSRFPRLYAMTPKSNRTSLARKR
jgi:hypothetical protein